MEIEGREWEMVEPRGYRAGAAAGGWVPVWLQGQVCWMSETTVEERRDEDAMVGDALWCGAA